MGKSGFLKVGHNACENSRSGRKVYFFSQKSGEVLLKTGLEIIAWRPLFAQDDVALKNLFKQNLFLFEAQDFQIAGTFAAEFQFNF